MTRAHAIVTCSTLRGAVSVIRACHRRLPTGRRCGTISGANNMERLERIEPNFVLSLGRRRQSAWVLAVCLLTGLVAGALVTLATAPVALALGAGAIGALILLRSPLLGLLSVVGVVILLPFAAVPLGIGFNPTFLNLALLATVTVWAIRAALGQERLVVPPVAPAVVGFMLMALFAFVLGLGHVRPTPAVLRHFGEFILAIVFALLLVNLLRTEALVTRVTRAIIIAGGLAALVGAVLYVLPDNVALRLLAPLRYLEYSVALRYIRDDPSLPERAIGTSVDPNAFGGLLVLVTALTVAQVFAPRPLLPRWLVAATSLIMGVTLILTFSRSAMVGVVMSLGIIAMLRYRRLLLWMALAAVVFLILPQTQGYIQHFIAGVRGEDLATQMRFGEYSDAFRLILRHPWFGVGFAGVPEIDIYLGVSSLYLLLAEYMGLVGLAVFLLTMALFFLHIAGQWQTIDNQRLRPIVLGAGAGLAGAMVSGILDHYFVNINFPHAVTLFWLFVGLALAASYVANEQSAAGSGGSRDVSGEQPREGAEASALGSRTASFVVAVFVPLAVLGLSMAAGGHIARADTAAPLSRRTLNSDGSGVLALNALEPAILRKIDPRLAKEATENPSAHQRFLVYLRERAELEDVALQALPAAERRQAMVEQLQAVADRTQRDLRTYLAQAEAAGHVQDYTPFWIVNGLAVQGDALALAELASHSDVAEVRMDRRHQLPEPDQVPGTYTAMPGEELEWGVARLEADVAWSALGIDGSGIVVCSLDSGVDWLHPDLKAAYRGQGDKDLPVHTGNWYSVTDEDYQYPGDGHGHGTHTTATMIGRNGVGVAPGATWIAVKVFHNQGHTFDSWLHDAFQWVLAPAGNPDLAPDVVNGSWGTDFGADETLRDDIRLLRAAGIIPVFSIGNNGPDVASIGSPASFPEVLAVGAMDQDGEVAEFSSRGPSVWGEIKPEVVAPGTRVQSAVPGGGRQAWNGTSMAAPHVTGVVALLRQANPDLTQDEIEHLLKTTAAPIGATVPNNDAGWGLVSAYRAVATAMRAGFISGQIRREVDGEPIADATVAVAERDSGPFARAITDADGHYELALPPGPYELAVSAFGFESKSVRGVRVSEGARTGHDVALDLSPAGVLTGQVTDAESGAPLAAEIHVVDTPVVVETGGTTPGSYAISLPPGEYELRVVSQNHKIGRATVSVAAGDSTVRHLKLVPAPSILLVDSGAWYYRSQAHYLEQALDDLHFNYDLWRIKHVEQELPMDDLLKDYDITIWSAPEDAPGLIGASSVITRYLEAGGRLLLTGQDIGYWDGGGSRDFFAAYYRDYLRAQYVQDDADFRAVRGVADSPFDGLFAGIGRGDSAHNQWYPDEVAVADTAFGRAVLYYGDPELTATNRVAGLMVGGCLPYRAVYLAFGFEGVDTATARSSLLARSIDALMAPVPPLDVLLSTPVDRQIVPAGSVGRHQATIRNLGSSATIFDVTLHDAAWSTELWDSDFTHLLEDGLRIEACEAATIGVQVNVPAVAPRHATDRVRIEAVSRSRLNGQPVMDAITLTTKTPAGVLLVDDDRWIHVEGAYAAALDDVSVGYDKWSIGWNTGTGLGVPSAQTLDLYPTVAWFTGYDWFQTLTEREEDLLGRYLDAGGRLFLSSQDYLYTSGLREFGRDYLGVVTYTEDLTSTVIAGEVGAAVGGGLGPLTLEYPFANHSDTVEPADGASTEFRGRNDKPVAVSHQPADGAFKTLFFAFPFEALTRPAARTVMGRIVDWFSPLHRSSATFDRTVATQGDEVKLTLRLRNDRADSGQRARLEATLTQHTEYVVGSLPGVTYDPAQRTLRWEIGVPAGGEAETAFRLRLAHDIPDATIIAQSVDVQDEAGLRIARSATLRVDAPDLATSEKTTSRPRAELGDTLSYTITLRNSGTADGGLIALTDRLPAQLEVVAGSLSASSGRTTTDSREIIWEGGVRRSEPVTITYRARVVGFGVATNVARIDDGAGVTTELRATTLVPTRLYLPYLRRSADQ